MPAQISRRAIGQEPERRLERRLECGSARARSGPGTEFCSRLARSAGAARRPIGDHRPPNRRHCLQARPFSGGVSRETCAAREPRSCNQPTASRAGALRGKSPGDRFTAPPCPHQVTGVPATRQQAIRLETRRASAAWLCTPRCAELTDARTPLAPRAASPPLDPSAPRLHPQHDQRARELTDPARPSPPVLLVPLGPIRASAPSLNDQRARRCCPRTPLHPAPARPRSASLPAPPRRLTGNRLSPSCTRRRSALGRNVSRET